MKTKIGTKLLSLLLCVCMLIPMFTACGNKDDDPPREPETYYTSMAVKYNPNGEYKGTLSFSDEVDDTFTDLSAENFTLSAYGYAGETEVSADLNDFSVKKTDDKNLEFTFKSPFGYNEDVSYILMSETTVTTKENKIAAAVYIYAPTPELDIEYIGSYQGTDEIKITATLTDDWKFADNITADMLSFPEGLDVSVDVARESDTKLIFTVTDIPENYSGVVLEAVLSENAIDSEFATDSYLSLDFFQPSLKIEPNSVSFDEATDTYTIGKVSLPDGVKGSENGISVSSALYTVAEQSYNEAENYYSFKLKIDADLGEDADAKHMLPYITVDAVLKTETEEIKYTFNPYTAIAGVKGDVITDAENGKVYVEITPYNAAFVNGFSATDVTVSGDDALTNFTVSSISADKLVYAADYTDVLTDGVVLSFDMQGTALNTSFGLDSYSLMLYVPPYSNGKAIDWGKLGGKLAKSAAGGLGSAIGESVAGFVLPYVYDFLDIDTSDSELNAIKESIEQLTRAIDDLSSDISNVTDDIEVGTNKTILDNFQTLETSLQTSTLKLLSDENVLNYVAYLNKTVGDHFDNIVNNEIGRKNFEEFTDYYISLYGSLEDAPNYTVDELRVSYNKWVSYAKLGYDDFYRKTSYDPDFTHCSWGYYGVLSASTVYDRLKDAEQYNILIAPTLEKDPKFEASVKELNYNYAYVNNIVNYGKRIVGNASGTSAGVIDLFFQVIDSMYNFESQTIAAKKAFVSKTQSVYLLSAAIAVQYCDATGDTGNASTIRSDVNNVMSKIDAAFKQIEEMEARAAKGNDKLLVSGQIVSKTMKQVNVGALKYDNMYTSNLYTSDITEALGGFVSISVNTYNSMIDRAKKKGITLAKDLEMAGFANLIANNGEEYCYMSTNAVKVDVEGTGETIGKALIGLIGISSDRKMYEYRATVVVQNGTASSSVRHDSTLVTVYQHMESAYTLFNDDKCYLYSKTHYSYVIGFAAAK